MDDKSHVDYDYPCLCTLLRLLRMGRLYWYRRNLYTSFAEAISFVRKYHFDGLVAVGGGSVMDTAKAANLYLCHPENDFLDFVNAPIGKGLPVQNNLKPLICGAFNAYTIFSSASRTGMYAPMSSIGNYRPLD